MHPFHRFLNQLQHSLALGLLFFFSLNVQAQNGPQPTLPTQRLTIGMHVIQAEVAATPPQRQSGLMFRTKLPPNGGMLFVFDEKTQHCMWMRNTLIALSVAFIDDKGRIINIEDMQPKTETVHCARQAARYALEMELGWFSKRGIKPGATVKGL
ncbi:MAG: DUF192 domain-containing protein [Burkholderiales bacterium]|jgi:uncharacterized membrane protein (UPF0127 family)|nr:DUF192 domain-containing protein [Burkholderiales bacterium]